MAESETGWTGPFLQVDGYYWMRLNADDNAPTIVRYEATRLYEIGTADDIRWERLESAQFLPASPADAEQLSELRKACEAARKWFRWYKSSRAYPSDAPVSSLTVLQMLEAVLNPKPEKETP